MQIKDIELVKFRLRRKLAKIEKRDTKKGFICWTTEHKLINDEAYQKAKSKLNQMI